MWTSLTGATGNYNPRNLGTIDRFKMYGTTDIRQIQRQVPTQTSPVYPTGFMTSLGEQYLSEINKLAGEKSDFGYTPRTLNWQDIRTREVSARAAADESLGFNEQNMARYGAMAEELTRIDTENRIAMLDQFVPDWRQKRDAASAINDSLMRGELPKDVADQLKRSAAYASVIQGGGAGVGRSLTARDLGTTSMELQQKGMAGAQSWTQMMAGLMPQQTTAAGVMATQGLTPQQTIEVAVQNAANQLTADTTNVQGRLEAAYKTQGLELDTAKAKQTSDLGWAQLRATGLSNWLTTLTGNAANAYGAAMNTSNIEFQNRMFAYQSEREMEGLRSGQTQRTGFGL